MWGKVNIWHLKRGQFFFPIMSFIGGSTAQLNTWLPQHSNYWIDYTFASDVYASPSMPAQSALSMKNSSEEVMREKTPSTMLKSPRPSLSLTRYPDHSPELYVTPTDWLILTKSCPVL